MTENTRQDWHMSQRSMTEGPINIQILIWHRMKWQRIHEWDISVWKGPGSYFRHSIHSHSRYKITSELVYSPVLCYHSPTRWYHRSPILSNQDWPSCTSALRQDGSLEIGNFPELPFSCWPRFARDIAPCLQCLKPMKLRVCRLLMKSGMWGYESPFLVGSVTIDLLDVTCKYSHVCSCVRGCWRRGPNELVLEWLGLYFFDVVRDHRLRSTQELEWRWPFWV